MAYDVRNQKPTVTRLGENIRSARERSDLSIRQLSQMIDVAESMLSGYERGARRPSLVTLASLALANECEIEELFTGVSAEEILAIPGHNKSLRAKSREWSIAKRKNAHG